jgi:TolB-like protein/class 3 adenylate cyclase
MSGNKANRRLVAIMAIDVVGYSRLVEADEIGTHAELKARRKDLLEPLVRKHGGRVFKVVGDGALVEFGSAVNAVQCAVELQEHFVSANERVPEPRRIELRIGVSLGDVAVEGGDLYGESVIQATRLEALADAGAVNVSADVCRQARGKVQYVFEDIGERQLKNIALPVHVYAIRYGAIEKAPLIIPDKPSIVVLPFQNIGGDAEQEYFADGMVDEITMALSRLRWLFVIARNSSFAYKGRAIDVRQVGRELGVRYVLEGSVRRAGDRLRLAGELIDAATGRQLWSDRFEGGLEAIFDLQDKLTANVVGAIAPRLESAEIERALRKPTESLGAYDHYLRGMNVYHRWTRTDCEFALSHFRRAIELDPKFASAYGMAARCYVQRKAGGWDVNPKQEIAEANQLARRAIEYGREDSVALGTAGFSLAWVAGSVEEGAALVEKALRLNPNFAWGWGFSGWINIWLGNPNLALEQLDRALRLSPHDPMSLTYQTAAACANFFNDRYDDAWLWAKIALQDRPDYGFPNCIGAASAAYANRPSEANEAILRLRRLMPNLSISNFKEFFPLQRTEDLEKFTKGLRLAGLSN